MSRTACQSFRFRALSPRAPAEGLPQWLRGRRDCRVPQGRHHRAGRAGTDQDEVLKGTPGKRLFEIGADGLRIPVGVDQLTPAVNGKDIKLTLNSDLQYFSQQAIQSQKEKLGAEWGVIVVSDAKTGDIIAMADTDAPDPNDPGRDCRRGPRGPGLSPPLRARVGGEDDHDRRRDRGGHSPAAGHLHHSVDVHGGRSERQ